MYKIGVGPNHPPGGSFECPPPFILSTSGSITIYLDPGPSVFRHPEKAVNFVKVNYNLPNRNTRVNISKLANKREKERERERGLSKLLSFKTSLETRERVTTYTKTNYKIKHWK